MRLANFIGVHNYSCRRIDCAEVGNAQADGKIKNITSKVWDVVKVIFSTAMSVSLFLINPSLFTVGFIIGVVWNEQTRHAIDKIQLVWKTQPWGMSIIAGVASFISLPVSLAATSFLWAANWGSILSSNAQEILKKQHPNPTIP